MLIGLDARFYGSSGGLARYTQQLINHLAELDATNQYVVFLGKANIHEFKTNNTNFKKILADACWYTLKEQILMPWKIWRANVGTPRRDVGTSLQLMHFPHWNVPLLFRGRFVVTIHDLILLKYPSKKATTLNPLFFAIKYWAYKKVLAHAIYDSLKIIVPSEFVKKDILAHFKVPADKIAVISEGAGLSLEHLNTGTLEHLDKKREIKGPYLLYVGVAYPHKNLEGLIEAFKIFYDKYSKDYHLVLVGQENYFYQRLKKIISNIQYPISYLGFIPDSELPALYQNASLYVFPSFYEGFGLPGLEAMNYGLPVIASGNSCLPEILGDAARYFDPHNLEEMAATMWQALSDKNLREQMRQRGFEQAKKYSWVRMAEKIKEMYLYTLNYEMS